MVHKMLLYLCLASVIICNVHNSVQGCVYCCIVCVCVCSVCIYYAYYFCVEVFKNLLEYGLLVLVCVLYIILFKDVCSMRVMCARV